MFDGFRNDTPDASAFDEPAEEFFTEEKAPAPKSAAPRKVVRHKTAGKIFGLDAKQRFALSIMLMFAVCMLGTMCMFITQKFIIP